MASNPGRLSWQEIAAVQAGAITVREAVGAGVARTEIRRRVAEGSWRQPLRGVLVTDTAPPSLRQRLWCAVLAVGRDAVLGGSAAATLDGLRGFERDPIVVLVPAGRRVTRVDGLVIRHTARLQAHDLHSSHLPVHTAPGRSVVDMAEWAPGREEALGVLTEAIRQGFVTARTLRDAIRRRGPITRRTLVVETLDDIGRATPTVLADHRSGEHRAVDHHFDDRGQPRSRGADRPEGRDSLGEVVRDVVRRTSNPSEGVTDAGPLP